MAKIKIILSQILPYFCQLLGMVFVIQSLVTLGFSRKCPELSACGSTLSKMSKVKFFKAFINSVLMSEIYSTLKFEPSGEISPALKETTGRKRAISSMLLTGLSERKRFFVSTPLPFKYGTIK